MVVTSLPNIAGAVPQIVLAMIFVVTATLWPPAEGDLLAVPFGGTDNATTINIAIAHGARIEGAGPFPHWIVLRGRRDRLAGPLRARGILLMAGASWMCGS